jgi:zinc/manganese transport system substrate-binding protein
MTSRKCRLSSLSHPSCLSGIRVLSVLAAIVVVAWAAQVSAQGKLNVIATTQDLAAIAAEIGGDRITIDSIAKGYQDPHFVEAKPSFILKLQRADLLIVVGRELEIGPLSSSKGPIS